MGDFILRSGDQIRVTIPEPAIVPVLEGPVPLQGSAEGLTVGDMPVCLLGDELPQALRELLEYTAPPFTNPGTGKLTVVLTPQNLTERTVADKQILIKGTEFSALFTVVTPATQDTPAGPVPDTVIEKAGTAQFITTNETVRAG